MTLSVGKLAQAIPRTAENLRKHDGNTRFRRFSVPGRPSQYLQSVYHRPFRKIFPIRSAIIKETIPAKNTTTNSHPAHTSNKTPYNALPSGCAHMETDNMSAMTLPISAGDVSACTKDMICTVKTVENIMIRKQHTVMTR